MIPYGRQTIEDDDIQAVVDVLKSDYLTTGPSIEAFEKAVCEYTGTKYAVAIANGTAALHAACFAAGIGPGDEVITTPLTFAASANCVLYCGGTPVFADVDINTYNIDPDDIERKITDRTKAIIPVHLAGQPCDLDRIHEIARKHNLIVIEDGAHALGSEYKGKKIGGLSHMTTFSFHPVKPITSGEGGMVMTNDKDLYDKLMLFRSHGITKNPELLTKNEGSWFYEQQFLGYNYRMTDIQCALGHSQLKKIDRFLEKRRALVDRYNKLLSGNENIVTPYQLPDTNSGWHLYIVQIKGVDRGKVFEELKRNGIGVNVHYIPVYHHPYYRENGYSEVCCNNAEKIYAQMFSLPLYPLLTFEQQDEVVEKLFSAIEKFK